jgi:hypothetical protein
VFIEKVKNSWNRETNRHFTGKISEIKRGILKRDFAGRNIK